MSENIELNKKVYSKAAYDQIIDTDFNQLGIKPIQTQIDTQPTLNEFFDLYNELFYTIPELGEIDSHEYLITKSSEYINFSANQDEIIALQNEIFQLRTELLDTQKQNIELQTGAPLSNPSNINSLEGGISTSAGGFSSGGGDY